jgi:hypothetical protein
MNNPRLTAFLYDLFLLTGSIWFIIAIGEWINAHH